MTSRGLSTWRYELLHKTRDEIFKVALIVEDQHPAFVPVFETVFDKFNFWGDTVKHSGGCRVESCSNDIKSLFCRCPGRGIDPENAAKGLLWSSAEFECNLTFALTPKRMQHENFWPVGRIGRGWKCLLNSSEKLSPDEMIYLNVRNEMVRHNWFPGQVCWT